jgi:hypothetical protein
LSCGLAPSRRCLRDDSVGGSGGLFRDGAKPTRELHGFEGVASDRSKRRRMRGGPWAVTHQPMRCASLHASYSSPSHAAGARGARGVTAPERKPGILPMATSGNHPGHHATSRALAKPAHRRGQPPQSPSFSGNRAWDFDVRERFCLLLPRLAKVSRRKTSRSEPGETAFDVSRAPQRPVVPASSTMQRETRPESSRRQSIWRHA